MQAIYNGVILAESDKTIEIEGNQYFPPDSIKEGVLTDSSTTSTCPWKGQAHYYDVLAGGSVNKDAAWYYPQPSKAAAKIKNYVAFWKGVEVK